MKKNDILIKVLSLAFFARRNGLKIAVAESCTSGLLASLLSSLAGSSAWFDFGVVCYSNLSKKTLLSVDLNSIKLHGSVSKIVASQMLAGLERIPLKKKKISFICFRRLRGLQVLQGVVKKNREDWFGSVSRHTGRVVLKNPFFLVAERKSEI